MSDLPWFRFYPSDWLGGTRGMKASEAGIYITLIATMYEREVPLPEDIGRLARLCGASQSSFKATLQMLVMEGKIERVNGGLWNKRVGREVETRTEKVSVARQNANHRWSSAGGKDQQKQGTKNADASKPQCQTNASQRPETRDQKKEKIVRKSKPTYPEDFEEFWNRWQHPSGENNNKWPTHTPKAAYSQWKQLTPDDRKRAFDGIVQYQSACLKAGHDPAHAFRYLRDRAFENFEPQAPPQKLIEVFPGTDEHAAWTTYFRQNDKPWMAKPGPMNVVSSFPKREEVIQ